MLHIDQHALDPRDEAGRLVGGFAGQRVRCLQARTKTDEVSTGTALAGDSEHVIGSVDRRRQRPIARRCPRPRLQRVRDVRHPRSCLFAHPHQLGDGEQEADRVGVGVVGADEGKFAAFGHHPFR